MSQKFTTLVDVEILAQHVDAPDWRIIDCRFDLADKHAGRRCYHQGHIPNALYADLEDDLSGQITPMTGRHPLPDAAVLAKRFGEWGIGPATQLVAYDGQNGALASHLWWLSRWLGHDRVAVLNGGFASWIEAHYPQVTTIPEVTPSKFNPTVKNQLQVSSEALQQCLAHEEVLLIDARDEARFHGESEPLDKVAGHIPGSLNLPFEKNLDASGKFLTPAQLLANFLPTVNHFHPKKIVHSCGSGVTACHNILAMEIIGLSGSLLYPGSWSEWITNPNRPVCMAKES